MQHHHESYWSETSMLHLGERGNRERQTLVSSSRPGQIIVASCIPFLPDLRPQWRGRGSRVSCV